MAVCAGLGAYDILRGVSEIADVTRYRPGAAVVFAVVVFLFIGHHLIVPADAARKPISPYPDYFDAAWKDAVQLILSAAFVGVFWLALALGAALFHLIGIDQVGHLIEKPWFALPVTGIASRRGAADGCSRRPDPGADGGPGSARGCCRSRPSSP